MPNWLPAAPPASASVAVTISDLSSDSTPGPVTADRRGRQRLVFQHTSGFGQRQRGVLDPWPQRASTDWIVRDVPLIHADRLGI